MFKTALAFATVLMVTPAGAHDGFEGRIDPVTKSSCCTSSANETTGDCRPLKVVPGMLEGVPEGWRLRLTEAQARDINPKRRGSVDTIIPWQRIQDSWDGNFRVCIPPYHSPTMLADFYCFWAPGQF